MAPHRYVNRTPDRAGVYYSDAVEAGDVLYVSGCLPATENAGSTPGDIESQVTEALTEVTGMLELSGYRVDDLVKLTIYLTDMEHAGYLAAPRAAILGDVRPATTTIGAGSLYKPWMRVEIDAIAVRSSATDPTPTPTAETR